MASKRELDGTDDNVSWERAGALVHHLLRLIAGMAKAAGGAHYNHVSAHELRQAICLRELRGHLSLQNKTVLDLESSLSEKSAHVRGLMFRYEERETEDIALFPAWKNMRYPTLRAFTHYIARQFPTLKSPGDENYGCRASDAPSRAQRNITKRYLPEDMRCESPDVLPEREIGTAELQALGKCCQVAPPALKKGERASGPKAKKRVTLAEEGQTLFFEDLEGEDRSSNWADQAEFNYLDVELHNFMIRYSMAHPDEDLDSAMHKITKSFEEHLAEEEVKRAKQIEADKAFLLSVFEENDPAWKISAVASVEDSSCSLETPAELWGIASSEPYGSGDDDEGYERVTPISSRVLMYVIHHIEDDVSLHGKCIGIIPIRLDFPLLLSNVVGSCITDGLLQERHRNTDVDPVKRCSEGCEGQEADVESADFDESLVDALSIMINYPPQSMEISNIQPPVGDDWNVALADEQSPVVPLAVIDLNLAACARCGDEVCEKSVIITDEKKVTQSDDQILQEMLNSSADILVVKKTRRGTLFFALEEEAKITQAKLKNNQTSAERQSLRRAEKRNKALARNENKKRPSVSPVESSDSF
eukprot:gene24697-29844_t